MNEEKKLGDRIKELRERSPFPERKSFALRAGISVEGLRKVENGVRLPEKITIEKIIKAASCPSAVADKVLGEWSAVQAKRLGVPVSVESSLKSIAEMLVDHIVMYIEEREWILPDSWKQDLTTIIADRLKHEVQQT